MSLFYPLIILCAGAMTALQPLINARLAEQLNHPVWASFISFLTGTLVLFCVGFLFSGRFLDLQMTGLKWWMFAGGFLGACFVTVGLLMVPKVGVATLIVFMIAGQLIGSALLDHYGVLSESVRPVNLQKLAGLAFAGLGAYLTLRA